MMRIGKLDRRIDIERATETTNDFGERVVSWSVAFSMWAALTIRKSGSFEKIVDGYETSVQMVEFTIRQSSNADGVTTSDRVSYGGKKFNIVAVHELERGVDIRLICENVL